MKVIAGDDGILQDLPLELGQWVTPGTLLAKVVQPGELKAELRIPETRRPATMSPWPARRGGTLATASSPATCAG